MSMLSFCLLSPSFRREDRATISKKNVVHFVLVLDALGLGSFRASLADQFGCVSFISSLLGVITVVLCGVVWYIIGNEVPFVYQRTELSATCAFMGIGA